MSLRCWLKRAKHSTPLRGYNRAVWIASDAGADAWCVGPRRLVQCIHMSRLKMEAVVMEWEQDGSTFTLR